LDFWSREVLEAIGNKLGSFVKLEPNWDSKKDRRWAWIMVEVDVREGLVGNIDLVYAGITWHQKVDYWRLPFRCHDSMKLVTFSLSVPDSRRCNNLLPESGKPSLQLKRRNLWRSSRWKERMKNVHWILTKGYSPVKR
jgi:hypothetical protein